MLHPQRGHHQSLFKIKDDELTFTRAIEIAAEVEEATRVAKETLGSPDTEIHKVLKKKPPAKSSYNKPAAPHPNFPRNRPQPHRQKGPQLRRYSRCDRAHSANTCRFATVTCRFCNIKGHTESSCRKRKR
ncbi:transposon ty3-i Gag-Pol polyprotein [Plakobranchus ocellatus]|uniref:Transposon ty3-i Gag-Pol polyprotein n=1 Tax=Plakobranchus ocellatus TaxID=259542 RepID=A0AAV3Z333_9GAST|nr:transposon ty3-i Gag-Pol polyprotein [Plakobranchus ocellatus]